ncbi:C2H2 type zinc finger domain protein [Metarhizium brunneum]
MRNIRVADGLEFCLGRSYEELELQGLVHRARILLVAQIIAADHVGDFVPLDADWWQQCGAGAGAGARKDQFTVEIAERRLRAWANADMDPVQPRRMACLGAQLLAIPRSYLYNILCEPYDAFGAGLLLWTMAPHTVIDR